MKFDLIGIQKSRNDERRCLRLPFEPSEELAEFIGILTGDGYMNYYPAQEKYLLEIAGNSQLDKEYFINNVSNLMYLLFKLKPAVIFRKDQKTMYLRLISKGLLNFLSHVGFKSGRKDQIGIPTWIRQDEKFMNMFVRGLADTDFCFHWRKNYPIISAELKSEILMCAIARHLRSEGFFVAGPYHRIRKDKRGYKDSEIYRIDLNGHKNLDRWITTIGVRNPRHLKKISVGLR